MDAPDAMRRRHALAAAGCDPDTAMTRMPSDVNDVWVGDDVVVRVNHRGLVGGDPDRLLREAAIAARLPDDALYPDVVGAGRTAEFSWLVARRAGRIDLGRAWPSLSPAERERA